MRMAPTTTMLSMTVTARLYAHMHKQLPGRAVRDPCPKIRADNPQRARLALQLGWSGALLIRFHTKIKFRNHGGALLASFLGLLSPDFGPRGFRGRKPSLQRPSCGHLSACGGARVNPATLQGSSRSSGPTSIFRATIWET
jgi:hypothetical protein